MRLCSSCFSLPWLLLTTPYLLVAPVSLRLLRTLLNVHLGRSHLKATDESQHPSIGMLIA